MTRPSRIVFVVLRNGTYAVLNSFAEPERTPGVPGLELPGLDIASLTMVFGCHNRRRVTKWHSGALAIGTENRCPRTTLAACRCLQPMPLLYRITHRGSHAASPSDRRMLARLRCIRDITVPSGTPMMSAVSRYVIPSTATQ